MFLFLFIWGSPKGWQFFKVLDEQSLAIKLATPEIYNCQTLYAPFSANRYNGCVEKRPLRRSLVHNNKRGAVSGDHEEQEEDEEKWKTGNPQAKLSLPRVGNVNVATV